MVAEGNDGRCAVMRREVRKHPERLKSRRQHGPRLRYSGVQGPIGVQSASRGAGSAPLYGDGVRQNELFTEYRFRKLKDCRVGAERRQIPGWY